MDPSRSYDAEDDDDLASEGELANLPWAEPPPRDPSPYPSLLRQPSLSFLASDPNQQQISNDTVSRRSSRSSIGSRRSQSHLSPGYLVNDNLSPPLNTHRFSAQTVHSFQSGMADMEVESQSHSVEQLGPTPPRTRDDSPRSAMAIRAESAMSNRSDRSIKSALKAKARSLKSTASSRKRNSNSTIHRRSFQKRYGKWEVEMSPLLEEDARRREEQLELSALLGRATVLERMLKAGRRVSLLSLIRAYLMFRYHARQPLSPRLNGLRRNPPNHLLILHHSKLHGPTARHLYDIPSPGVIDVKTNLRKSIPSPTSDQQQLKTLPLTKISKRRRRTGSSLFPKRLYGYLSKMISPHNRPVFPFLPVQAKNAPR